MTWPRAASVTVSVTVSVTGALSAAAVHDQPTAPDRHTRPAPGPGGHTGRTRAGGGKMGMTAAKKLIL